MSKKSCLVCHKEFAGDLQRCPDDGTILIGYSQSSLVGTTLAHKYVVESLIGTGATSVVYKAMHLHMERAVAIKVLKPHLISDEQTMKRFEREARAVSALMHANLVTVYDVGMTTTGEPYIVMEYLQGGSLADLIKHGSLGLERALPIFIQTASAMAHAHKKGVIHRDMKPSNIMLIRTDDSPFHVKIVDFGLAKLQDPTGESPRLTKTGDVFGSPIYMSPEQCTGKIVDERTDIYSFGILMFETLTGRPPFRGDHSIEVIRKQLKDPVPSFKETCPDVIFPAEIEAIVSKALKKNQEERYQSMDEIRHDLEFLAQGGSSLKSDEPAAVATDPKKKTMAIVAVVSFLVIIVVIVLALSIGH